MLYTFLSMLIVVSSDVVKHECRTGCTWLRFPFYFVVAVLLRLMSIYFNVTYLHDLL